MIRIVTALACEARPFLEGLKLSRSGSHGRVTFYEGSDASLAVSGVGSLQSAIASTALFLRSKASAEDIWINIGICGHCDLPIGEALLANRIVSPLRKEAFYPRLLSKSPFTQCGLLTSPEPCSEYPKNLAIDMEAYGFVQACLHFSTLERIQVIKVVSDNASKPAGSRRFDKDAISERINSRFDAIWSFASELAVLSSSPKPQSDTRALESALLDACHYSATERFQLQKRLSKLAYLLPESELPDPAVLSKRSKAEANSALQTLIDQASAIRKK